MNTAEYVDNQIQILKNSGIPLTDAAWQAALLCVGWPYIYGDRGQYCTIAHRQAVYNKDPGKKVYQNVKEKCQAIRSSNPTGSCSGCKWYPKSKRVRGNDCRGFTYWILLQIYGWKLMGTGATKQWNTESNWKAKGLVSKGVPDDTLVCLFYPDEKDPNVMEHTGFGYHGETIECSAGVQYNKTRDQKWTHWAVPACVDGDVPTPTPSPTPTPDKKPTLRKGSTGEYVVECQEDLIKLGYDLSPYGADGKYGNKTAAAVAAFQKDHPPLVSDGICGPLTWAELDEAVKPQPDPGPSEVLYTVTIEHLDLTQAKALCNAYPTASMKEEGSDA